MQFVQRCDKYFTTYMKLDHLISKKITEILVQIFTALIAYLILMMIQDMLSHFMRTPDLIDYFRHGIPLPFKSAAIS